MGLPTPCTHVVLNDKEWEVFRCKVDGGIVIQTQSSLAAHAGHRLANPVILTNEELIQLESELLNG